MEYYWPSLPWIQGPHGDLVQGGQWLFNVPDLFFTLSILQTYPIYLSIYPSLTHKHTQTCIQTHTHTLSSHPNLTQYKPYFHHLLSTYPIILI